jgi:hypothetical protein
LRVQPTKRKVIRHEVSTRLPTTATHRNHVWTWDFIANATDVTSLFRASFFR